MLTNSHVDRSADSLLIEWQLRQRQSQVWNHLKNSEKLAEWLGRPLLFDARVGGEIVVDHDDGYLCRSEILSLPRTHSVELSWQFPDEPATRLSLSTVEVTDAAGQYESTTLMLEHLGLGSLIDSYVSGWMTHLTYYEASLCGTPLPSGQFWSLCATFAQLHGASADEG